MPDREHPRRAAPSSRQHPPTSSSNPSVRRNLFQQHLTRRPTTSSTSTSTSHSNSNSSHSAETLRLDIDPESDSSSDIVIRDKNGEFEIEELSLGQGFEEQEEGEGMEGEDEKERQRLADAVRHHQRDRNRAPSEPAELLEAVRASLRAKVNALAGDNWMYEAEEEAPLR